MRRIMLGLTVLLLGAAALLDTKRSASACGYGMAGPLEQFLVSDFIIVGKVMAVEDCTIMNVNATNPNEATAQAYRVVTVSVVESLKGAQGLAAIRVGFQPGSEPRIGAEGCFYLTATPHSFSTIAGGYVFPMYREGNPGFDKARETPRQLGKLWENPTIGLRSKNPDERLLTAALVLRHHRGTGRVVAKGSMLAPIDAEQSQLILEALAEADWSKPGLHRQSALRVFGMLDLTAADGWTPADVVTTRADFAHTAKTWLKTHTKEYRIRGLVAQK